VADLDSNTRALSGLRIAVGILFLIFGEYKVFGTKFTLGGGFEYWCASPKRCPPSKRSDTSEHATRIEFGRVAHDKTVEAAACDSG
jgi:hypothetical protein